MAMQGTRMQITRFLFVGALATATQYFFLWLGVDMLRWPAGAASGLGYLMGSALSYLMNYFFTFRSMRPHAQTVVRFYIMVAVGWLSNTTLMTILADTMDWNKWLSQIIATALVLIWNFSASRNWIFRPT